jgi:hypothetical protein
MTAPPQRRSFSFSLRTSFVLLTILGAVLAWAGYQLKWIRDRHAALVELPKYGNYARNDGQTITADGLGFGSVKPSILVTTSRAPWSLRPFLESGIAMITIAETADAAADDRAVQQLSRLFPEADVQKQPNPAASSAQPFHYEEDIKTGTVRRW